MGDFEASGPSREATPVKRRLVRLCRRKLRFYASYEDGLDRLTDPTPSAARGSRPVTDRRADGQALHR